MRMAVRAAETVMKSQSGKAPKRRVDGVLLLDKAEGISSNHALQQVKRLFNAEKAGHTGTLDPFASGLLPICFGEATKFAAFMLEADKGYEATVALGVTTDSGDRDGRVLARHPVHVGEAQIEPALAGLRGQISQTPPMYSAVKKNGKHLYEYARQGIEVERAQRRVEVHTLEFVAWRGNELDISMTCSKGTYVRTLAEQIGAALGCGAHLSRLRRTASGAFRLADAIGFDALAAADAAARARRLLPVDALVAALPRLELEPAQAADLQHGRCIAYRGAAPACARAYAAGRFLGVVGVGAGELRAQRLMSSSGGQPIPGRAHVDLEASAV